MTAFTDSHCHLDFPELSTDLTSLLDACFQQKIKRIIIPSVEPKNWSAVLKLSRIHRGNECKVKLFSCLGIHPWFLKDLSGIHLDLLEKKVTKSISKIIAIGETGIDSIIAKEQGDFKNNIKKQQQFFDFQLSLAKQYHLPLIIHHRNSHHHIIPMIKHQKLTSGGVIHAFSGSYQQAKSYLDLNFKLGVGGTITYPRAIKTIETFKKVPLTSLVLETDAPSMPIKGKQGKYNSPINLVEIFNQLTSIRHEDQTSIAQQLEKNIDELFFSS